MSDTPITRGDILTMDAQAYEHWLIGVRERMMALRKKYEAVARAKSAARVDALTPKLEKADAQLRKKMDKTDSDIEKISLLIVKIQTLIEEINSEQRFAEGQGDGQHPELRLGEGVDGT